MRLKIPPVIIFFLSLGILFGVYQLTPEFRWDYPFRTLLSRIFLIGGALIALAAMSAFRLKGTTVDPRRPEEASSLVTSGVYQYSRNPMYLGMALVLIGGVIRIGNPFCVLGVCFFVWYLTQFQIKPEEDALKKVFGEAYENFCTDVRRWV